MTGGDADSENDSPQCFNCHGEEDLEEYILTRPGGGTTISVLCPDCADEAGVGPHV